MIRVTMGDSAARNHDGDCNISAGVDLYLCLIEGMRGIAWIKVGTMH